jgi:hypothetical protein
MILSPTTLPFAWIILCMARFEEHFQSLPQINLLFDSFP